MFRPLFHLATSQPQLLADHVEAYADLASCELRVATAQWKRRLSLHLAGAAALGATLVLTGIAIMLWGVLPATSMSQPWLLWLVPTVPALAGIGCCWLAGPDASAQNFALLRRQWAADRAMLREASVA